MEVLFIPFIDEQIIAIIETKKMEKQERKSWSVQVEDIVKEIKAGKITASNMEMERHEFFNHSFSLYMPKSLDEMNKEDMRSKYPNENRPELIYADSTDAINIGINMIEEDESFKKEDLTVFRDLMLQAFVSVSPSSKVLDKDEFSNDFGNLIAYFAFDSFAIGGSMYNLVFATLLESKVVVISLNCATKAMDENKLLFYGIMHTASVKEKHEANELLGGIRF